MWAPNKGTGFWESVINAFVGKALGGLDYNYWTDICEKKVKSKADKNIAYCLDHMLYQGHNESETYFRREMQKCVTECYRPDGPKDPKVRHDIFLAKYQGE